MSSEGVFGRWDLRILHPEGEFPSWAELSPDGGWFVGRVGSARPIVNLNSNGASIEFSLPKQYESRTNDLQFQGMLRGEMLEGSFLTDDEDWVPFAGTRAPSLARTAEPTWGVPVELIGQDLSNWTPRSPDWDNNWSIEDGRLVNSGVGTDLVTKQRFGDFRLVAEYSYPEGSNSGIYLRGRYEFQILDDFGKAPSVGSSGAIYGFITPSENAVLEPERVNRAEITLLGRTVTVVLNGKTIVDAQEIPGITGGALDSDEGTPGPLFVQGDHGPVTFHRLTLTPGR